jgi:hypothetical protein
VTAPATPAREGTAARPEGWEIACALALLALFGLRFWHHLQAGTLANMLWLCALANLLMTAGLLGRQRTLVRIGMLWTLTALPLWLIDVVVAGTNLPSVLFHLGGAGVALLVWRSPHWQPRRNDWLLAWLGALAVQALTRAITPPALNVNLAHAVHASATAFVSSYPVYAAVVAAGTGAGLYALQRLLQAAKRRSSATPSALSSGVPR